jgi:hypothetical protein
MTSHVTVSGKHKCEESVCSMESTKDDSPLKARFFAVRKEVYKLFKEKQQTEQQAASEALKRSMSDREWDSEVIDVDNDITVPGASKQTNRTVTDRLIKKPSHEDFVAVWSEAVLGKGLTFAWERYSFAQICVSEGVRSFPIRKCEYRESQGEERKRLQVFLVFLCLFVTGLKKARSEGKKCHAKTMKSKKSW